MVILSRLSAGLVPLQKAFGQKRRGFRPVEYKGGGGPKGRFIHFRGSFRYPYLVGT